MTSDLADQLIRHQSNGVTIVCPPFDWLYRKEVPSYVEACPYRIQTQQAAVPHLKLPTEH